MKTCPICDTDYPDQHSTCPSDGAVLIVSHELEPGSLVRGKYRITGKLGQGGMGVVYLAEHMLLGGQVALKFLSGELGKDPRFIKRFRMEARAAYQLRHPNIVEVTDLDQGEDGSLFIAMEYVEGLSLRAVLEQAPKGLAIPRALEMARGIATGLAAAHAQGMVHRDIKPENILVAITADGRERPKILDFGLVAITENVTRVSVTRGLLLTPDYAAPEQWLETPAGELDGRTDLYALGCVLYEMLTGNTPFHAHSTTGWMKQHLDESAKPSSLLRPELANWQGLDALLLQLLAKDRALRPKNAADLLSQLDAVRYEPAAVRRPTVVEETVKRPVTVIEETVKRPETIRDETPVQLRAEVVPTQKPSSRKFPRWAWAGLAALALIAAFAIWRLNMPRPHPNVPNNIPNVEQQAEALYTQKSYSAAIPLFTQACDGGNSMACRYLGGMYWSGQGVEEDMDRAFALWNKEATFYSRDCNAGDAAACVQAGIKYEGSSGIVTDYPLAMSLYSKACDAGNASGCHHLGAMYEQGEGVAKDSSRAAALYSKACDAGDGPGCHALAVLYKNGLGVEKNATRAAALYNKACDAGEGSACSDLAIMYWKGQDVEEDTARGMVLYNKACDAGDGAGCSGLAVIYENGWTVPKDSARAAAFYGKACDTYYPGACKHLGDMYEKGEGVAKDSEKAKEFHAKDSISGLNY
jgi:TPR repeat protein/serine/threonine protein kinase